MQTPPSDWITTGVFWESDRPILEVADRSGNSRTLPVDPGNWLALDFGTPRRCIGWWRPQTQHRQPCPLDSVLPPSGSSAQCASCGAADPGRTFARGAVLDDGRTHALYLAWFGPRLLKVGTTALERGSNRLAEQGAVAYVWVATGPLPGIRHLEQRVSAAGIAPQQRRRPEKVTAWWSASTAEDRAAELVTAHQLIRDTIPAGTTTPQEADVHDNLARFGLAAVPDRYDEITELAPQATVAGTVIVACGRDLLINLADAGPTLVDSRLLAGRPTLPSSSQRTRGITAETRARPRSSDADETLF